MNRYRRLVFVRAVDLELWRCRPIGNIRVLDLSDRGVGHIDGLIIDSEADRPLFLVIAAGTDRPRSFLVAVGDSWFDETERAVRIDATRGSNDTASFDVDEFEALSNGESAEYERKILARCCPELGLHRDGTPDYDKVSSFRCPAWVKAPGEGAGARVKGGVAGLRRA